MQMSVVQMTEFVEMDLPSSEAAVLARVYVKMAFV
jgi:hypothetical protein